MQTINRDQKPRLAPIRLNNPEAAGPEGLNRQLDIISTEEGVTIKRVILEALKKYRPELTELINKEIKASK